MKLVRLDFADRDFPASVVDVDEPDLPGPGWVRVKVTGGGICGSDLHLFKQTVGPTPLMTSMVGMPMEMGHEISGEVIEAGTDAGVTEGTRVAIDPVIGCEARGIEPLCPNCAKGAASACHNLGSHCLTPGFALGYTSGLGCGWGEQVLAHRSMLHVVPDEVATEAIVLHEPLSISVHGLLRHPPQDGTPALVVGAGIIGLAAVAALRALVPASDVTVIAKHDYQKEAAVALGAKHIVEPSPSGSHLVELAEIAGTTVEGAGAMALLAGGFPYVVEAVGTEGAISDALRVADGTGTVLLLGAAGITNVDLTPVWFKELTIVGSFCHAHDATLGGGPSRHSIERALEILASGAMPHDRLITHEFGLDDVRDAVATANAKTESAAIKVVLRPN